LARLPKLPEPWLEWLPATVNGAEVAPALPDEVSFVRA